MSRPTLDEWALKLAVDTSERSTCLRRAVGCVLLNAHGHVIATGYNGVSTGEPHCNEYYEQSVAEWVSVVPTPDDPSIYADDTHQVYNHYPHACKGAGEPSGQALDACRATHAEINALAQCADVWKIKTCYVTVSPCWFCIGPLMNSSCERIVFLEEYPHDEARQRWVQANARRAAGGRLRRTWEMVGAEVIY